MEVKCIISVVLVFVIQSSLGYHSSKADDLRNEIASGFSAIETYHKIAISEHSKTVTNTFVTLKYYLDHSNTKEFSIEIAKNKTTVAAINCLNATWEAVLSVRPDALSDITSLRKVWDHKATQLFDSIYSAIILACGEQNQETRSKIDNIESVAISNAKPLNADIFSPFLNDKVTQAWVKDVEQRATFEFLHEIRAFFVGIRILLNRDENAFDTMQETQTEAIDRFMAQLDIIFSFLKTTLVAYSLIKAGSIGETSAVQSHPGSGSSRYNHGLDDTSAIIDDYLRKIASGNEYRTSNDFCGFDALQEASLIEVLTGLNIIFSSITIEFGERDFDDENIAENYLSANNVVENKSFMKMKKSIQILFDVIPMMQCGNSSVYKNAQRVAFDRVRLLIKNIYIGIRLAKEKNCPDSEVEMDAMEKAALSKIPVYIESVFTVIRSSSEYQRRMEPLIQHIQAISVSKVQTAVQKTFIGIKILQAKGSFRNQTECHDTGLSAIENVHKEAAYALTAKNLFLFNTVQYLYTTLPPEREEILDRLLEIQFGNSLALSEIKRAVDFVFATVEAFLPTVSFENQNQILPGIQSNGSFTTETAINASYEGIKRNFEAVLNSYSSLVPDASAPITNGRSAIYTMLMDVIRYIYNAIGLAADSTNAPQSLVEIDAIKESVIYKIGITNLAIFAALKTPQTDQPEIMNAIENAKQIIVPEYTNVLRAIFAAIEALYESKQIAGSSQSKPMIKDSYSQIKAAHMKAYSAIKIKTETAFELMLILFNSLSSYETGIGIDSCTDVSS